jgi:NADPH:quinone reductase-like Zn-dependent oxidoreductase
MKAIQYTSFGNSGVLELKQVSKPVCKEDEVLIKITATTVNPFDMKIRSGNMQKIVPVQLPFIPGSDVVGTVEAVGRDVKRIKTGDEVFSTTLGGAYAEYVAIKEERVALKPGNVSANEAAALVVPLNTSYSVLIEAAQVQAGQRVLIHGASGGIGSVLVQMAKVLGAYVIGTASGKGVDLIKMYGADEVIDYKTQDFTKLAKNIDVVADLVGGEALVRSFEVLAAGGKLLSIVMPPPSELAEKFKVTAKFVSSSISYKKLDYCRQLVEQGKIKAHIAKVMRLEQAAEAQDLISGGGVNGKIVLEIN